MTYMQSLERPGVRGLFLCDESSHLGRHPYPPSDRSIRITGLAIYSRQNLDSLVLKCKVLRTWELTGDSSLPPTRFPQNIQKQQLNPTILMGIGLILLARLTA